MDFRRTSTALTREQKLAVVSVADVKAQERITNSYEDALIGQYIEAAYDYLAGPDGWLGRCCLLEETFEAYIPNPGGGFELPIRPVVDLSSITGFEVSDGAGGYDPVSAALYAKSVNEGFGYILHSGQSSWPISIGVDPRRYKVTFKAGFGAADDVPSPIKLGIIMLASHFYQNREATFSDNRITAVSRQIEFGLRNLCGRYRISRDHS
ncbi:head-tail connector protein [Bosea minatitlanensis]|uniref:Phage gp6-like head-tail connector protein n=1 Tax=Bosea minatitlanensis TaxID=128782 RepID=A0ABW0F391_9HYPH|nr:hypothetical protein [Bosea minatitlanensis]MCT4492717.1 hypothetical protein [Bosea minatitlanensis]